MKDSELIYSDSLKDLIRRNKKPYDFGKMAVASFSVVPFILLVVLVSKRGNFKNNAAMYSTMLFLGISLFITVAAGSFLLYLKHRKNNLFIAKNKKIDGTSSFGKKVCFVTLDVLQEDKLITGEKISYIKMTSGEDYGSELKITYSNGEERKVKVGNMRFFYNISENQIEKLRDHFNGRKGDYGRLVFSFELGKHLLFDKRKEILNNFVLKELEIGSYSSVIIKGDSIAIKTRGNNSRINESEYFKAEYLNVVMDKDLIRTSGDEFKDKIIANSEILIPLIVMLSSTSDKRSDGVTPKELKMMKKEIKSLFSIEDITEIDDIAQLAYNENFPEKEKVLEKLKKNVIDHSFKIIGKEITPSEYDEMLRNFCEVLKEKSKTVITFSQKTIGRLIREIVDLAYKENTGESIERIRNSEPYNIRVDKVLEASVSNAIYYPRFKKKLLERKGVSVIEKLSDSESSRNP